MASRQYGVPEDPQPGFRQKERGGGSLSYGEQNRSAAEPKTKKEDPSPAGRAVTDFHKNDDVDVRRESHHHTLGPTSTQAAPGDHTHDGGTSRLLLDGIILTGSKNNPVTMWPSIINALKKLGAEDQTT